MLHHGSIIKLSFSYSAAAMRDHLLGVETSILADCVQLRSSINRSVHLHGVNLIMRNPNYKVSSICYYEYHNPSYVKSLDK